MKTLKTLNGKQLHLDEEKWVLSNEPICTIKGEDEVNYVLQTKNGSKSFIPKEIIRVNEIEIKDNVLVLSPRLYEYYVLDKLRSRTFDYGQVFNENADLIFRNKEIVISKAEYYLLSPPLLSSGGAYTGGFSYNIGSLLEVWEKTNDFYFAEFDNHKDMYLICLQGSPLSGAHQKSFWCKDEGKVISYSFSGPPLGKGITFFEYLMLFKDAMRQRIRLELDFQDVIMAQLLADINNA